MTPNARFARVAANAVWGDVDWARARLKAFAGRTVHVSPWPLPGFVLRVTAGQFNTQQKLALRFSTEFNGFEAWPDAWDKYHLYNQNNAQVLLKHAPENGGGWVKFETCDCIRPFDWSTQPLKVVGRSSSTVSTRGRVGDEVTVTGWFDLRESKLDKGLSLIADTVPDPSRTLKFTFRRRT